jgi:hypothetical protein
MSLLRLWRGAGWQRLFRLAGWLYAPDTSPEETDSNERCCYFF